MSIKRIEKAINDYIDPTRTPPTKTAKQFKYFSAIKRLQPEDLQYYLLNRRATLSKKLTPAQFEEIEDKANRYKTKKVNYTKGTTEAKRRANDKALIKDLRRQLAIKHNESIERVTHRNELNIKANNELNALLYSGTPLSSAVEKFITKYFGCIEAAKIEQRTYNHTLIMECIEGYISMHYEYPTNFRIAQETKLSYDHVTRHIEQIPQHLKRDSNIILSLRQRALTQLFARTMDGDTDLKAIKLFLSETRAGKQTINYTDNSIVMTFLKTLPEAQRAHAEAQIIELIPTLKAATNE